MAQTQDSKLEVEVGVQCNPQKLYDAIKNKLHHLPTIFPEVYKDAQLLQGDGKSIGSITLYKYVVPGGSSELMSVKAETTEVDDKNMTVVLLTVGGQLEEQFSKFLCRIEVSPKSGGSSSVKWTVEYAKRSDDVPNPKPYMDMFAALIKKLDAYYQ